MGVELSIGKREISEHGDAVNCKLEDYYNCAHSKYSYVGIMISMLEEVMGIEIPWDNPNIPIFIKITPDIIEHIHQYALENKLDGEYREFANDEYKEFAVYWIPFAYQKYGDQAYVEIR